MGHMRHPLMPYLHPQMRAYERLVRPDHRNKPTKVSVQMFLRDMGPVDLDKDVRNIEMFKIEGHC